MSEDLKLRYAYELIEALENKDIHQIVINQADGEKLIYDRREKTRWIPVSERLPDIGEHYVSEPCLCYCSNGAYCFGELQGNIFGQVGWDCERDDDYHEAVGEVVAWMPLPDAFEEDE